MCLDLRNASCGMVAGGARCRLKSKEGTRGSEIQYLSTTVCQKAGKGHPTLEYEEVTWTDVSLAIKLRTWRKEPQGGFPGTSRCKFFPDGHVIPPLYRTKPSYCLGDARSPTQVASAAIVQH